MAIFFLIQTKGIEKIFLLLIPSCDWHVSNSFFIKFWNFVFICSLLTLELFNQLAKQHKDWLAVQFSRVSFDWWSIFVTFSLNCVYSFYFLMNLIFLINFFPIKFHYDFFCENPQRFFAPTIDRLTPFCKILFKIIYTHT